MGVPTAWVLLWLVKGSAALTSGAAYFGTQDACLRAAAAYEAMEGLGRVVETACVEDPIPVEF